MTQDDTNLTDYVPDYPAVMVPGQGGSLARRILCLIDHHSPARRCQSRTAF